MGTVTIPSRAPGTVWYLRRDFEQYVRAIEDDLILIRLVDSGSDTHPVVFAALTRPDARLLAKRLNQCLDATTKKAGSR